MRKALVCFRIYTHEDLVGVFFVWLVRFQQETV